MGKLSTWYLKEFKDKPVLVLIISGFLAIGSAYGSIQGIIAGYEWLTSASSTRRLTDTNSVEMGASLYIEDEYKKLEQIKAGEVSIKFVESIFGVPQIEKNFESPVATTSDASGNSVGRRKWQGLEGYCEYIYVMPEYYLQLITNKDDVVVYYSVTARNNDFKPQIPLELFEYDNPEPLLGNLRLGEFSFEKLYTDQHLPEWTSLTNWGMLYFYEESHYFGNPGQYQHFLFSISPVGSNWNESKDKLTDLFLKYRAESTEQLFTHDDFRKWHRVSLPNTFAIVTGPTENNVLLAYLKIEGIGANYYDVRKFN